MARKVYDRVKEYTASTGIGGISFIGAFTGFQSFDSVFTSGDTTFYVIEEHNQWEVGIGTYGSHNLERDTVLSSSNNGSKINLTGSGVVSVTYPASQVFFADDVVDVSGVAYYASGQAVENELQIASVSGWAKYYVENQDHSATAVSGWASSEIDQLYLDDDHVSGIAYYASGQAVLNQGDIASVSGLIGDADFLPGATGALIDQNTQQIASVSGWSQVYVDNGDAAVSGWAQSGLDGLTGDLSSLSGWTQSGLDTVVSDLGSVSGWAQSGLDGLTSDLASVSGWTQSGLDSVVSDLASVSGWTQSGLDSVVSDLASVSGWTQSGLDDLTSDLTSVSGWTQFGLDSVVSDLASVSGWTTDNFNTINTDVDYVSGIASYASGQAIQNESDIAAVSGLIGVADFLPGATGALIDQNSEDIATASGALRDSINQNILDIASVSGLLTPSGTDFSFSNAILTYFNSAGGSFEVDLSSISGDVYAMIVDGAPTTLDTLNEIAAALNDDANIANTLTTLITSASGNLQSQITDNLNDLSSTSGYFETRVDGADAEILSVSGWAGTYADAGDAAVSGWAGTYADAGDAAVSGWAGTYADAGDAAVSGWSENTFSTLLQMEYVSGIATYASGNSTGGGGGSTYTSGSGITIDGDDNIHVYGGSGNFQYIELQTDNTLIPKMKFTGSGVTDTPISLEVASSFESATGSGSALLFQGTQGQLFSITDNLSSGTIFSVSDITGLPMLEIDASGHVQIGEFADDITLHQAVLLSGGVPSDTTNKLYNNAGELYFNGASLGYDDTYVSGIATYASGQVIENKADIVYISGVAAGGITAEDLEYVSGIAVYGSGLDNYLLNPSGVDGIAITSTPDHVIFSGDATLARVSDLNVISGVATSQTLQSITDNGSTTSNAITINNDLTAEFIFAELDGPIVFECKNSTGAQIDAGTPVYISGYFGTNGKALIAPARSDDSTKMPAIGVLEEDLIHDAEGHVNSFGRIQGVDTSSFTVGNTVYVAPTGGLTNVRPTGISELVQNMGKVLRSDASQGRILLLGPGRSNDVPNSGQFAELTVNGHFSAVTKSFLIDHPSKEGMKLQYASLEGPENGVYVRGTTKETFITLPSYWRDLVHNSSITVTLTSVGSFQPLFVESKSNREIIVGGVCGYYDYVVYGERKDVAKLEVEW